MELFQDNGCLTEEGLQALVNNQLDELGRLEAAEHLSYCDQCMDRYTALLTADALETPPRSVRSTVMTTIWVRLMQNTYGRMAVAGVAAVLALTMWRSGALTTLLDHSLVQTALPSQTISETACPAGKPLPEQQGKPMTSRREFYSGLSGVLDHLLPGKTDKTAGRRAASATTRDS